MNSKTMRNSSLELLRIIAAYLIILRHFVGSASFPIWDQSLSVNKVVLEGILFPSGKVGVSLFFLISAWFLAEGNSNGGGIRKNFKRIWGLEREVLSYSIALLLFCTLIWPDTFSLSMAVRSFLPTTTELWWYVTSYVVFLLLLPLLTHGLHALGRIAHRNLCIITFIIWSLAGGILPIQVFSIRANSVLIFIYLYILVSYWRWYAITITKKFATFAIIIGYAYLTLSVIALTLLNRYVDFSSSLQGAYGQYEWTLPVILISFGIFALFKDLTFSNRAINKIASTTFAVYLIAVYPTISAKIWNTCVDISKYYSTPLLIPYALVVAALVFLICSTIDLIRQFLFKMTIDRNKCGWFERFANLYSRNIKKISSIIHRILSL